MKPLYPISALAILVLISTSARAQCPFNPTITPADLILCPNSQDTLHTQVYDSYQWYRSGSALIGQTGPGLPVDAYSDAGYSFTVEATLDGCTEMSPEVLVDGWAFLPPTVMTVAPDPLYFTQNGPVYCGLDTVLLVMMLPYDTNIQWTNYSVPIPGATDDTLLVTDQGQYSVSGAPSTCPDFVQQLGLWVDVLFAEPVQAVIVQNGDQLCATPTGFAYQWYLNNEPLAGTNLPCIEGTQPGSYTVTVFNENDCSIPSDGFLITGIGEASHRTELQVSPLPANDQLTITSGDGTPIGRWALLDATGRVMLRADGLKHNSVVVDVSTLAMGMYWLNTEGRIAVPMIIAR